MNKQNLDRFKMRWFDKNFNFMADIVSLDVDDNHAVVSYSFADEYTPDEEVYLSDGILMQSTGLKDKNGNLIYEGDIVHRQAIAVFSRKESNGTVKYHQDKFVIQWDIDNTILSDLNIWDGGNNAIEIIGNIYQHPELLEEDKQQN